MKENRSEEEDLASRSLPQRSFIVALEQMAQFLRSEIKFKDKDTKVLSASSLPSSFNNSIEQIAKLLRSQVRAAKSNKKRSWKTSSKSKKEKS